MTTVQVPVVRCTVCDTPYVLRFSLRMTAPAEWVYQRDCKHKAGPPTGILDVDKIETAPLTIVGASSGSQPASRSLSKAVQRALLAFDSDGVARRSNYTDAEKHLVSWQTVSTLEREGLCELIPREYETFRLTTAGRAERAVVGTAS